MTFTLSQRREASKRLPPNVQDFIISNEVTDLTSQLLQSTGLSEEQTILADSEILCALVGLQTLDTAIKNIATATQKPEGSLSKLKSDLWENIFKKIEALGIDESDFVEASKAASADRKTSSVLEVAPNNLPEVLPGQIAHNVPHLESMPI